MVGVRDGDLRQLHADNPSNSLRSTTNGTADHLYPYPDYSLELPSIPILPMALVGPPESPVESSINFLASNLTFIRIHLESHLQRVQSKHQLVVFRYPSFRSKQSKSSYSISAIYAAWQIIATVMRERERSTLFHRIAFYHVHQHPQSTLKAHPKHSIQVPFIETNHASY